jgi:hypothetical protein
VSGTSTANASAGDASKRDAAGLPQRWCPDHEWLVPAAELYTSVYKKASRPVTPETIDADLAAGGVLRAKERRTAGKKVIPANTDPHELREFLVSVAHAEASGIDPLKYARHIVATCES